MDNNYNVARKSSDDFITIPDLWHLCVARWNLFVVSLLLIVVYARLSISSMVFTAMFWAQKWHLVVL